MAVSGSDKRQRKLIRTVRVNTMEDAVLRLNAGQAGLTVASYIRRAALHMPPPAGGGCPSVNQRLAIQLLAEIGQLTTAFDRAGRLRADVDAALVETALRDVLEMRLVLLETVGRQP